MTLTRSIDNYFARWNRLEYSSTIKNPCPLSQPGEIGSLVCSLSYSTKNINAHFVFRRSPVLPLKNITMTWTRLHDACQHHDYSRVVSIVRTASDEVMMVDDHGSNPLHLACWGNPPLEVVQALLKACPPAATDKDILGNTPLHIASGYPGTDPYLIREILEFCPTAASIINKEGLTPLHVACRHAPNNVGVISALIDAHPHALKTRTRVSARKREFLSDLSR